MFRNLRYNMHETLSAMREVASELAGAAKDMAAMRATDYFDASKQRAIEKRYR